MEACTRIVAPALAALLALACATAAADPAAAANQPKPSSRQKVCLALSGGGARGGAHLGVLKALEELRVPIHCIAGTSFGAVIGGLYASGLSTQQIEHELSTLDWESLFQDSQPRPDRSFRRKQDDRSNFSRVKPGIKDGGITFPPAFVQGQKFDLELSRLTLPVAHVSDFDKLRVRFRAVATDISTGKAVVIGKGDLARAIHASMAVPSAFAAVELDGQLLVDGGVANNLPVDVARSLGADVVIAVDVSTPLLKRENLGSAISIFDQLTNILVRNSTERQVARLGGRDVLIIPDMQDVGFGDFERVAEAVALGKAAAEGVRDKLGRHAVSPNAYAAHQQRGPQQRTGLPVIAFVKVNNQSGVRDELILQRLELEPGDPLDVAKLEEGISRVYGLESFESVRYEVVQQNGATGLVVHAREKSWGTDFLQFGAELATDLDGASSAFNLAVIYTSLPMNRLNGEWRLGLQIGEEPTLFTEWFQPLDPLSRYFVHASAARQTQRVNVFDGDRILAEYQVKTNGVQLAVGREFGTWSEFRLGLQRYTGTADVTVGEPVVGEPSFEGGEAYARFAVDTLDNVRFPREGYAGALQWTASRESLAADSEFDQVSLSLARARSWRSNTVFGRVYFASTLDDDPAPIQNQFALGGFTQLSGFLPRQISGPHAGLVAAGYMRRLHAVRLLTLYAGATLEAGNVWASEDDISARSPATGGSLFLGMDLPIGPLYLGYGVTEGRDALFLLLGQPWF